MHEEWAIEARRDALHGSLGFFCLMGFSREWARHEGFWSGWRR